MSRILLVAMLLATLTGLGLTTGASSFSSPLAPPKTVVELGTSQAASQSCPNPLSEEDAHRALWRNPDVQRMAEEMRAAGARPITSTLYAPDPQQPPKPGDIFVMTLAEDLPNHVVPVARYNVDACTGQVTQDEGFPYTPPARAGPPDPSPPPTENRSLGSLPDPGWQSSYLCW